MIILNNKVNDNNKKKIEDISHTLKKQGTGKIKSDVQGSYTGLDKKYEQPVQDVDDL